MITEQQMMELAAKVNNTYLHMDKAFGGQCWDSAAWIMNHFGLPVINTGNTATKKGRWPGWAGNMVDCFPQSDAIAAAYELVAPDQPVQPGDTLVWGDSYKEWYPATHVATAIKDKLNGWVLCLSQNSSAPRPDLPGYSPDASGPTIIQLLPKRGLIGIIRPRYGMGYASTTPIDEDEEMNQEQFNNLVAKLDELNAAHHVATRTHVNNKTQEILNKLQDVLNREPLLIDRLDVLNTAHHVATREHVNGVRETLLGNMRAMIDLLKQDAAPEAVEIAEAAYAAFEEKLKGFKVTITTGGE